MNIRKTKRAFIYELALIVIVFLLIDTLLFVGLKSYFRVRFSEERMQALIDGPSNWKEKTDDPCKWAVYGDPDAKDTYIKLIINCPDKPTSTNTLDLRAIKGNTYVDLLTGYSKLQGIEGLSIDRDGVLTGWGILTNSADSRWVCFSELNEITDLRDNVHARSEVYCSYASNKDIIKIRNEYSR